MPLLVYDTNLIELPFGALLTENSVPGANYNAIGDYSVVAKDFGFIFPFPAKLNSFSIKMSGAGPYPFSGYGNSIAPLNNGINVTFTIGGLVSTITVNPIFTNWDWTLQSNGSDGENNPGNQTDFSIVNFNFGFVKGNGFAFDAGDSINFKLNDDFQSLDNHSFILFGGI